MSNKISVQDGLANYIENNKATINADANADDPWSQSSTNLSQGNPTETVLEIKYPNVPNAEESPAPILPKDPNVLDNYSSYTHLFTFACLTNEEVSQPDKTYRQNPLKKPIIQSAGGLGDTKIQTIYEKNGRFEYFIDNVEISSIIQPTEKTRTTNATLITFDVKEPYSLGLFLQTLQIAAQPEYENYLAAPFMLKVEFVGYRDFDATYEQIPNSTRYFPLKLTKVDFSVDGGGSTYNVRAIPWNEQALTDVIQETKSDITITGSTLSEVLQTGPKSLASIINSRLLELEQAKQIEKADEVIIVFPTTRTSGVSEYGGETENNSGATTQSSKSSNSTEMQKEYDDQEVWESLGQNPNESPPEDFDAYVSKILGFVVRRSNLSESIKTAQENGDINNIGKSKLLTSVNSPGPQPFGFAKFDYDSKNKAWKSGNTTISNEFRDYTFPRGAKIEKIIEEMILLSNYGRELSKAITTDKEEFINWFRIETQVYPIPNKGTAAQIGRPPMVYVYRILPYKVHSSVLLSPSRPGIGYDRLKEQAAKEYNYIYTGRNKDILEFDITLNNSFFTAVSADYDAKHSTNVQGAKIGKTPDEQPAFGTAQSGSQTSQQGISRIEQQNAPTTGQNYSGNHEDTQTRVARTFHDAIVNSQVDLLTLNMTIIGDPYYIADSGMGNYNSESTQYINITADGSMNYQESEVDVIVNFRTPLDYNESGQMEFPEDTVPVNTFSGLYRVLKVTNSFSSGKFTQELQLIRRRNQDENVDEATADRISTRVEATPEQKIAQSKIISKIETKVKDIDQSGRVRGGL